ncbi:short chain dehydrogenase/reductase [Halenospora varia]|nr:short chain dehydrogenase/reductase [Halenospora varia]
MPILPIEGLTIEVFAKTFRTILLQPVLTGALLLARSQDQSKYDQLISTVTKNRINPSLFDSVTKVLLVSGLLYQLNNTLTRLALNNFRSDKSWDWQKEVVLVTGGCSGIGQLIVEKLSEQNIKVVIFDVVEPRSPLSPTTKFYKVDITSTSAIHEAAEKIREEVGHPTVLVNNAGVGFNKEILESTEEQIRLTFNVNVVAHFLLVREFVPHMIQENHGHIVTIASMASFLVHAGNVDYASTKAAALAFHEGLSQELKARYGASKVRTTVVHPTWVRTPLIEHLSKKKDFKDFVLEPATVANAVVSQIRKAESAQLILPGRYSIMSSARGWPSWLQEGLRNSVANLLRNVG